MTTTTELATGLRGTLGSHYVAATRQLYFVEVDGNVSVLDLVRRLDAVVFEGKAAMAVDSSLSLIDDLTTRGGELSLDHHSAGGQLVMRPQGSCALSYLGLADYDGLTHASLQGLSYTTGSLPGEGPENLLVEGAVFAVFNRNRNKAADFDYAKVQVTDAGEELTLRWATYRLDPAYRVLARGYQQPADIVVASDGHNAYVTETTGNLLRIDLRGTLDRAAAAVVATGLDRPHQMALDEPRSRAYVVETDTQGSSSLAVIDLVTGIRSVVTRGLTNALGLVVTGDGRTAYVSHQGPGTSSICRVNLADGRREELPVTLGVAGPLAWSATGESRILTTDQASRELVMVDVEGPLALARIASLPQGPSSVAATAPSTVLVCCDQVIVQLDLTSAAFAGIDNLLRGIGHVARTRITLGYATTQPGYLFQVKDAPFGGTLPVLLDHQQAFAMGARYYQVLVDGAVQSDPFSDDLFVHALNREVLTLAPMVGAFFAVRNPGERWHNPHLGCLLATAGRIPDGARTIEVRVFRSPDPASEIVAARSDLLVQIDNTAPRAAIKRILHHLPAGTEVVSECGIVRGTSDAFTFDIEAHDPAGQHLRGWSLHALWGDNKRALVESQAYEAGRVSGHPRQWAGVTGPVPATPWLAWQEGDETSIKCAHTFVLDVSDRAIDGWRYIHSATYSKSITLLLERPLVRP